MPTPLFVSQNLYGVLSSDGFSLAPLGPPLRVLSNGLACHQGSLYLSDWSDLLVLDPVSGALRERLPTPARNIHTLRFLKGRPLLASTADARVFWGEELLFDPRDHDIPPAPPYGYYLNAAIPSPDGAEVLIGLRSHRAVLFLDLASRTLRTTVLLPFLRNLHHPTPYPHLSDEGLFLVSDDASVVLVDAEGHPLVRSPDIPWPRGILVEGRTRVWVASRRGLVRWNPIANQIDRRIDSPLPPPSSLPERKEDNPAGALFDVATPSP